MRWFIESGWLTWFLWVLATAALMVMSHYSGKREGYELGYMDGAEWQREQGIEHLPDITDTGDRREEQPRDPDAPRARIHESRWTNGYW